MSVFSHVPLAPPDAIFGLTAEFKADQTADKINLVVGAYRTDEGTPLVLNCVRKAEQLVDNSPLVNKEYLPIDGLPELYQSASRLLFGGSLYSEHSPRIVSLQSLSGTGSLRVGLEFAKRFLPATTAVYLSNPTWPNHQTILETVGLPFHYYRYWDSTNNTLNFTGLCQDLREAPNGSVVLLHACAHNPTGMDPSLDQWKELADLMKEKGHFAFLDCAYQGFASGDLEKDVASIRIFLEKGLEFLVAQSFAKNFGLYGERVGALHIVCSSESVTAAVRSQMKVLARAGYSNPPMHGAYIVSTILGNQDLYSEWINELKGMAERIQKMRQLLHDELAKQGVHWPHLIQQIGMFGYTGLTASQVQTLKQKYHIYMTSNGRISLAGVNTGNISRLATAIGDVVKSSKM